MELQEIEIQQRHVVLAAVHLGLDAVAAARPVELVMPFAEKRAAVRVAHELEEGRVVFHLAQRHGGHRLVGLVIELVPWRHAGVDVEISGRRAIAAMDLRRILPGEIDSPIALQPEALHFGARIEPGLRRRAVGVEHPGRGIVGRGIGVQVDIVLVQRPDVAAVVGRAAEGHHSFLAAVLRIGRNMIGQLDVVAVALPVVRR